VISKVTVNYKQNEQTVKDLKKRQQMIGDKIRQQKQVTGRTT
jgi:hypothetical protein